MSEAAGAAAMPRIDPKWYRQVLAQYPTGVCAITARQADGTPLGMIVGSFTSVSLDPPLVAFLPERTSTTWAKLRRCERFCVNILSADQEAVCRQLASRVPDKFAGLRCTSAPGGAPIIAGAVAWIDCALYRIAEAGDHDIVLGLVEHMEIADGGLPLLFFQGGYGRFAPASLAAAETGAMIGEQLRVLDRARTEMEQLAATCPARCTAIARVGDEILIVASAGQARHHGPTTLVGQRLPFVPSGAVLAAWLPPLEAERWIAEAVAPSAREAAREALAAVRARGVSVGLAGAVPAEVRRDGHQPDLADLVAGLRHDPPVMSAAEWSSVRLVAAPVFDAGGRVALGLLLDDFVQTSPASSPRSPAACAALLRAAAQRVSAALGPADAA